MDIITTNMFNYQEVYDEIIESISEKSVFVEIGPFLGESTEYLLTKAYENNKNIVLYPIDTWINVPKKCDNKIIKSIMSISKSDGIMLSFIKRIKNSGFLNKIVPMKLNSEQASRLFNDEEVDFIMIDGDHDYPTTKININLWMSKIKDGGIICGHGYENEECKKAVHEVLSQNSITIIDLPDTPALSNSSCWISKKINNKFIPYTRRQNSE